MFPPFFFFLLYNTHGFHIRFHVEELQLATRLQATSLKERKRFGGIFRDHVVDTRQYLEHVRESTTGTLGRPVKLFTNHFRVTSRPQQVTYKYNIDYLPDIEDGKVRSELLLQHKAFIGECHIFDGSSLLLPHKLLLPKTELVSLLKNQVVKLTIEFISELSPNSPDCLRYYNILFRRILKQMNLKQVGRNYYNKQEATEFFDHKLVIWPGYVTSILEYETSITLCADVNHKLLRMQTAYDLITGLRDPQTKKEDVEQVSKELIGSIVFTLYNNKTYRVDAINWEDNPRTKFKKSGGAEITFVDYYREQYNTEVTDLTQPLLISKGKWKKSQQDTPHKPIMLVPELCYLTGLSDKMRKDYRVMRDLALHMRLDPEKRQHELRKLMNTIQTNREVQRELQLWDLKFDTNFMSFSGRILKEVRIFQGRRFDSHPQFADWSRETRSGPLLNVKSLDHWLILYPTRNYGAASSLVQSLRKVTPTMGIAMREAKMLEVSDTVQSYTTVLENHVSSKTQMVLCVLSSEKKDLYDGIKQYLCVNCPTPSQCVVARTLDKPQTLMTIATKIAQQMNCKMGGALWKVETGLQNAMFIGIDCFHDIVNRRKSIAGFVSSINQELTQWFSQCIFQESGQELVNGLKTCLEAALKLWCKHNQFLPQAIIVYRDGVGDGQLQALMDHEVPQIDWCVGGLYLPVKLTFIVVKKRINTRFFVESQGRLQNPLPGTVIDVEVTKRQWYDFFIVSQSVKDGTVTPTHYNVIHDTVCFTPDRIQYLTYRLCHMYYNLPGVIRVPAPCHYAHKLAYLVGQSIHQEPHHSLASRLFYL
uniref:Piwi like RNA-mediated gene silencing 3 n=1 Tax=Canis lupus familiaris TaxID=9615 RepID=A0A8C0TW56_CANLF